MVSCDDSLKLHGNKVAHNFYFYTLARIHTPTPAHLHTLPYSLPASVSVSTPTGMACHKFGTQLALVADNFILIKYANEIIEPE